MLEESVRKGKELMKITYIHHSSVCVELDGKVLVFDYYKGDGVPSCVYSGKMPKFAKETPIYVFSSHSHRDHFDVEVLNWSKYYRNIYYIFAKEVKKKLGNTLIKRLGFDESIKEKITYVKPREQWNIGELVVETLLSTDSGVAFLITVSGKVIYHAGDLNWWKWEEESKEFNDYQEKTYKEEIDWLSNRQVDFAFVVLDPRQEKDKYLGIDYFMKQVQAIHVMPIHLWKQYGLIEEYRNFPTSLEFKDKILMVERENQEFEINV